MDNKFSAVKATGDQLMACAQGNNGGAPTAMHGKLPADVNLQGNWMAHVDYKYSCTVPMTKPEMGNDTGSWSMTISGKPEQLAAQVNTQPSGFMMNGSSTPEGMRLCGAFPLKGKGTVANTRDNNICIVVSEAMSPTKLLGHLEGEYATTSANCKVQEAKLELTR